MSQLPSLSDSPNNAAWKVNILHQLRARYSLETLAYGDVVDAYYEMNKRNAEMKENQKDLELQISRHKRETSELNDAFKHMSTSSTGTSESAVRELQAKVVSLSGELTDAFRTKAETSEKIAQLTERIQALQSSYTKQSEECARLKTDVNSKREEIDRLNINLSAYESSIQMLKDEMTTMRLELRKMEEKLVTAHADKAAVVDKLNLLMSQRQEVDDEMMVRNTATVSEAQASSFTRDAKQSIRAVVPESMMKIGNERAYEEVVVPKSSKLRVRAHSLELNCLAYSNSGNVVATGSQDDTIRMWDTAVGTPKTCLRGHKGPVMSITFSPDDEFVLSASGDNTARLWKVSTERVVHALTGHSGKVFAAQFLYRQSVTSPMIITGSHDRSLKFWDMMKGIQMRTVFCSSSVNTLNINGGGVIACGHVDGRVRLFDVRNGEMVMDMDTGIIGQVTSVVFDPMDECKLLVNSRDNKLSLFDTRTYKEVYAMDHAAYKTGLNWAQCCFSPDGNYVAAGGHKGGLFVWDAKTCKTVAHLEGQHTSPIAGCQWSPTGRQVATAEKDMMLCLWN